ncbi:MAG: cytochrome b [bacterium]
MSKLRNSEARFGWMSILLHWFIALIVFAEFGVGLYMTGLVYYHPLYNSLPHFHESVGIILGLLVIARLIWSLLEIKPVPGAGVGIWEQRASFVVKNLMTAALIGIIAFGYLLSTAEGDPLEVFKWFRLPAVTLSGNQEDISIFWHYWLAWTVIALASLHTLGALKHHIIDRDQTLRRMFGLREKAK